MTQNPDNAAATTNSAGAGEQDLADNAYEAAARAAAADPEGTGSRPPDSSTG